MGNKLGKVLSILDILLYRLRERMNPYESMDGMSDLTRIVIITVFNSLINVIATERDQFLDGTLEVPDENPEAVALAIAASYMEKARKITEKRMFAAWNQANALTVIRMVTNEIAQLKAERNLPDVQIPIEEEIEQTISTNDEDFPPPDFSDPGMIPDPHTCMAKVAENEELAARARACGRDDLAEQYKSVAARWRYLYEEAEDEEMEW